jgi:hypothetical protein
VLKKREVMVSAARDLLSAVTRLLILADMVDVHLLLKYLRVVSLYVSTHEFHLIESYACYELRFFCLRRIHICVPVCIYALPYVLHW